MRYIGVNVHHDGAICILNEEGQIEFYGETERYTRFKQDFLNHVVFNRNFPDLRWRKSDLICAVSERDNVSTKRLKGHTHRLFRPYVFYGHLHPCERHFGAAPNLVIDHHLAHLLSAWCYRKDDEERLALGYDGAGRDTFNNYSASLVGMMGPSGFTPLEAAVPIPTSAPFGQIIKEFDGGSPGKAMGMAGYYLKEWSVDKLFAATIDLMFKEPHNVQSPMTGGEMNEWNMGYIANFYRWYINHIWRAVRENIDRFSFGRGVVIAGGTTLALDLNTRIHNHVGGNVVFGPPTNDSGLALGAAAMAYFHDKGVFPKVGTASLQALQSPLPAIGPQEPEEIAKLLAEGEVVALLRGGGEAGPRALGFRSILASASKAENLQRVSQHIKGREFYRPLAPMVTSEQFDRLFDGPQGEWMQYRVMVKEEARDVIPAVVHADGSSRPQVVSVSRDPWLHRLLVAYGEQTDGVECLINTSLNTSGHAIANTYADAAEDLKGKDVEVVSIATEKWRAK